MKKIMIISLLALTISFCGSACNSSGSTAPNGDSAHAAADSSSGPATMPTSNTTTNADTSSNMLNNNVGKDSMAMDSSKMKPKMK